MLMLKKIALFVIVFYFNSNAQFYQLHQDEALMQGGLGIIWINGAPNYGLRLFPEIQFNNIGIGLDLHLEYTPDGKLREENFNEFSDYLSILRYIRYGKKGDPLYVRLGSLDYATLGYGNIMYMYNNSPSFDSKKVGLEFDADFNDFGFESVYSNFGQAGLIGVRGFIKPMHFTGLLYTPIIGNLEVGLTIASDQDKNAGVLAGNYDFNTGSFIPTIDEGGVTLVSVDVGFPIVHSSVAYLDAYFDATKIIKFGSGAAIGLMLNLKGIGLADVKARLERRFNGNNYIPSYFNSLYEIERFNLDKTNGIVKSKIQQLKEAVNQSNGYYGELYANVLGLFNVLGSFQKLDNVAESGILHLYTQIAPTDFPYIFRAGYDKTAVRNFSDIFKLDERSYFYSELGYRVMNYIVLSMVYYWTYTPVRDENKNIIGYKPQKRVEPRISFYYPLDF
ncbi:hypothetical protein ABRY23_08225 [Melioribacteraceae bacterium 4301-Me]|uniref:hypothetical protein n=1 Tax=Pyranulibacter aquaticus TaxID=3163344 RepID=UPI00359A8C24